MLTFGLTLAILLSAAVADKEAESGKEARLYTSFRNQKCEVNGEYGHCTSTYTCILQGGKVLGGCASGLGSCCEAMLVCGGSSSSNVTTIVNPGYPNYATMPSTCQYKIFRASDVCHLHLEFVEFDLSPPYADAITPQPNYGKCLNDQMRAVEGVGRKNFEYFCGRTPHRMWHFNIDVEGVSSGTPTILEFRLSNAVAYNRKWKILVSQLPCSLRIPTGCGQYFTGYAGEIFSFNWKNNNAYLHGFKYAVCVRREKDVCSYSIFDKGDKSDINCMDVFHIPSDYLVEATNPFRVFQMYCRLTLQKTPALLPFFNMALRPTEFKFTYNGPLRFTFFTDPTGATGRGTNQFPEFNLGFYYEWIAVKGC